MTTEVHEYLFRKDAEAAAKDQFENMGREVLVEYNGRGFVLRYSECAYVPSKPRPLREEQDD